MAILVSEQGSASANMRENLGASNGNDADANA